MPPAREMDMLLTAGERISMALVAMAIANLGHTALVHRLAGRRHHRLGARQGPHHRRDPGRITSALGDGHVVIVAGLPGRQPGQQGDHDAGAWGLRHDRGGPGRGPRRRRLRDLQRRRRRLHRRPAHRAHRAQGRPHHQRGDAGDGRLGAKILHLRCVEYARRFNMPIHVRSSFSQREAPGSPQGRRTTWKPRHRRVAHDRSEARSPSSASRTTRARPRRSSRRAPTPRSTST